MAPGEPVHEDEPIAFPPGATTGAVAEGIAEALGIGVRVIIGAHQLGPVVIDGKPSRKVTPMGSMLHHSGLEVRIGKVSLLDPFETFAAGQTVATVAAVATDIIDDTTVEGSEQFSLVLAPITADADLLGVDFARGMATIIDGDAPGSALSPALTAVDVIYGFSNLDQFVAHIASMSEPSLSFTY